MSDAKHFPIHALIVSAGQGSRFGADVPKQYLPLLGKTLLQHSVSRLNIPQIADLTLVIAQDDKVAKNLSFDFELPIHWAVGGAERFLSVLSGVSSLRERGVHDDAWVLIHDAARPCLPLEDLQKLICTVQAPDFDAVGAVLGVPVADTLKWVEHQHIIKTVDRSQLYQAQTPQIFRLSALCDMLQTVADTNTLITDEASGFEQLGQNVVMVSGSRLNIKLTYPDDLPLIEAILSAQFDQSIKA